MADGSILSPFTDLATALMNPKLASGHTIYLRTGIHRLHEDTTHRLAGVTIKPYQSELAVIEIDEHDLFILSTIHLRDVTLRCDIETRPEREGAGNISIGGGEVALTNVRITGPGNVGWWKGSTGIWTGVLVQDTGWTDSIQGHSLYLQNNASDGMKVFNACIAVGGYGFALHLYGSNSAPLQGFRFNCSIFIGRSLLGGSPIDDVEIDNCVFYSGIELGYSIDANQTTTVRNSLVRRLQIAADWQGLTVQKCIVLGGDGDCIVIVPGVTYENLHIDNNVYISRKMTPFLVNGVGGYTFEQWQALTGCDANSRFYTNVTDAAAAGDLVLPIVKLMPVHEGDHIANIAIWNPLRDETVSVDLSTLELSPGDYELRQVRDYDADRRVFAYAGQPISIDMTGTIHWPPGWTETQTAVPANAMPEFGAFELWKHSTNGT